MATDCNPQQLEFQGGGRRTVEVRACSLGREPQEGRPPFPIKAPKERRQTAFELPSPLPGLFELFRRSRFLGLAPQATCRQPSGLSRRTLRCTGRGEVRTSWGSAVRLSRAQPVTGSTDGAGGIMSTSTMRRR
jgi:hypothetical protein